MMNHDQLLRLIREKVTHPATPKELEQRLKIPREQRGTFKRLLKDLVARGALLETRGNRFGLADMMDVVVGRVVTHPRGFGFVAADRPIEGLKGDLYISGNNLKDRKSTRLNSSH